MTELSQLSLSGLAHRCRRETDRFFRGQMYDPSVCHELFRRALAERDNQAWEILYDQYRPLVLSWIHKHPAFADCGEDDEYFINRAFERIWTGLGSDKFDPSKPLSELLAYLKRCVVTAIIDYSRRQGPPPLPEEAMVSANPAAGPDNLVERSLSSRTLWEMIASRMQNEKELRFVFARFTLDMQPKEIYAEYPGLFANIGEVYRTYENLMDRFRRDPELAALWEARG